MMIWGSKFFDPLIRVDFSAFHARELPPHHLMLCAFEVGDLLDSVKIDL